MKKKKTIKKPVLSKQPTSNQPVKKPVSKQPTSNQPVKKPVSKQPIKKQVVKKPVTKQPVKKQPVKQKPTTKPIPKKTQKPILKQPEKKTPVKQKPTKKPTLPTPTIQPTKAPEPHYYYVVGADGKRHKKKYVEYKTGSARKKSKYNKFQTALAELRKSEKDFDKSGSYQEALHFIWQRNKLEPLNQLINNFDIVWNDYINEFKGVAGDLFVQKVIEDYNDVNWWKIKEEIEELEKVAKGYNKEVDVFVRDADNIIAENNIIQINVAGVKEGILDGLNRYIDKRSEDEKVGTGKSDSSSVIFHFDDMDDEGKPKPSITQQKNGRYRIEYTVQGLGDYFRKYNIPIPQPPTKKKKISAPAEEEEETPELPIFQPPVTPAAEPAEPPAKKLSESDKYAIEVRETKKIKAEAFEKLLKEKVISLDKYIELINKL